MVRMYHRIILNRNKTCRSDNNRIETVSEITRIEFNNTKLRKLTEINTISMVRLISDIQS